MITYCSFRNIYTYISEYYFKIFICVLINPFLLFSTAFLSQEIVGIHAHLSKCWRGSLHCQRKFDNACPERKPSPIATGKLWWA